MFFQQWIICLFLTSADMVTVQTLTSGWGLLPRGLGLWQPTYGCTGELDWGFLINPGLGKWGKFTAKPVENSWFIVGLPNLRCFFPVRKLCKLSLPEGIDVPLISQFEIYRGVRFHFSLKPIHWPTGQTNLGHGCFVFLVWGVMKCFLWVRVVLTIHQSEFNLNPHWAMESHLLGRKLETSHDNPWHNQQSDAISVFLTDPFLQ